MPPDLPPVVSDPDYCPDRPAPEWDDEGGMEHVWGKDFGGPLTDIDYNFCRYCGGRRP